MFVEMHNRQSDVSYSFLETREEDDEDEIPVLKSSNNMLNQKLSQKNSQLNSWIKVCCVFSLSGVVFLSIIGAMLLSNTIYLRVSEKNSNRKPALAEGVFGAICIYLAIFGWTLFLWLRTSPCLYGIFRSNKRFEL
eukprot:gene22211-28760_t